MRDYLLLVVITVIGPKDYEVLRKRDKLAQLTHRVWHRGANLANDEEIKNSGFSRKPFTSFMRNIGQKSARIERFLHLF